MRRQRFTPLVASLVVFVLGLGLGAGRSEADTSAVNTASKVLLTLGSFALVVSVVLLGTAYVRSRRTASPPTGGGSDR